LSVPRLAVWAPAKVNLCLAVGERGPDGYHRVDTWMLALERADRLELERRPGSTGVELEVVGPAAAGVPDGPGNLAARALEGLLRGAGERHPDLARAGLRLRLEKHVPAGAGLGGGSSDAAAAVLGGCRLLGIDPDAPWVLEDLARLGSDCAFFLAARETGLARCTGRGERVAPRALPPGGFPWTLLVLVPDLSCSTAEVYAAFERAPRRRARVPELEAWLGGPLGPARRRLQNDLEPAARSSHPQLEALFAVLEELAPGAFALSGSGSSCFTFCADPGSAAELLGRLEGALKARDLGLRGAWVTRARGAGAVLEP